MNNTRTEDKPSTCNQFRKAQSETDCASDNYKLCVVCTRVSLHVGYDTLFLVITLLSITRYTRYT